MAKKMLLFYPNSAVQPRELQLPSFHLRLLALLSVLKSVGYKNKTSRPGYLFLYLKRSSGADS